MREGRRCALRPGLLWFHPSRSLHPRTRHLFPPVSVTHHSVELSCCCSQICLCILALRNFTSQPDRATGDDSQALIHEAEDIVSFSDRLRFPTSVVAVVVATDPEGPNVCHSRGINSCCLFFFSKVTKQNTTQTQHKHNTNKSPNKTNHETKPKKTKSCCPCFCFQN